MALPRSPSGVGIGPGLYRRGTSPHDTVAGARVRRRHADQDGHNFVVEYAVTIGLVGLALLLTWLVLAASGARGELAWFAAFGGVSLLLQPAVRGPHPVLALALGPRLRPRRAGSRIDPWARGGDHRARDRCRRCPRRLAVSVVLIRGDVQFDAPRPTAARDRAPGDAGVGAMDRPAEFLARVELARCHRSRRVGPRPPGRERGGGPGRSAPGSWLLVGQIEVQRHHPARAARAYEEALRWNPQSTTALLALARIADARGDDPRSPLGAGGCGRSCTWRCAHRRRAESSAGRATPLGHGAQREHRDHAGADGADDRPTMAPSAVELPQSPWQPISVTP